MSALSDADTDELVERARLGDRQATNRLFDRHRARLRRMIEIRIDPRLMARLDPSDVIQETFVEAFRRLPAYMKKRPLPFYPWLRQIAGERLIDAHRRHLHARRRFVGRELAQAVPFSEQSGYELVNRLLARESSAETKVLREELRQRMWQAVSRLPAVYREVLVMRHLEDMTTAEIAATLQISEPGVKSRQLRALVKLRTLLDDQVRDET